MNNLMILLRRQALSLSPIFKLQMSFFILAIGMWVHFYGPEGADFGVKAATLAVFTGFLLMLELLPTNDTLMGRIASYFNRVNGALFALGVGWNWISSETGGSPASVVWPIIGVAGYYLMGLTIGSAISSRLFVSRPIRTQEFSPEIESALLAEYERLIDALEDENARRAEIGGFIASLEINLANLLLFLRNDPKSGLTQEKLDNLLRYADLDFGGKSAGVAVGSHHRRLRLLIRGALAETSPSP